jgi:hypothetical protein
MIGSFAIDAYPSSAPPNAVVDRVYSQSLYCRRPSASRCSIAAE